jgi:MFS transporter, DHA1 family, multidrug resistance protein
LWPRSPAQSPTIGLLLAARFVQALGACVGPVLGRAIVRDLYEPRAGGRILGYMASAMALAPLIAPFLGGWLEVAFGWRASFWALAAYGLLLAGLLAWRLEETLPERPAGAFSLGRLAANYALILHNRTFVGFMLCVALTFGALFTWISNSAFVVIDYFDVPPERFGWAFGAVIAGYVAGAYGGSRAGMRLGLGRATAIGCAISAGAGIALALSGWSGQGGLPAIVLLMALSFVGVGFVAPQATAGALSPFPHLAGTAAALLGFLQMTTGLFGQSRDQRLVRRHAAPDGHRQPRLRPARARRLVVLAARPGRAGLTAAGSRRFHLPGRPRRAHLIPAGRPYRRPSGLHAILR